MLSEVQAKKLTHFFRILDNDKNGVLEKQDFVRVGENVCLALGVSEGSSEYHDVVRKCKKMYNIIYHHIPSDDLDKIKLDTWLSYFDIKRHDIEFEVLIDDFIELTVNNVFEIFDQNNDGSITIDEYSDMFRIYGIDVTYSQKGFEYLDTDHNKKITREELLQALKEFFTSSDVNAKGNWAFGSWN